MECKVIPGFPDYVVSESGKIWRRLRSKEHRGLYRPLKGKVRKTGYLEVILTPAPGAKPKSFAVHRLVLTSWVRPPVGDEECDHINHVREDNRVVNLRWMSPDAHRSRVALPYKDNAYYLSSKADRDRRASRKK